MVARRFVGLVAPGQVHADKHGRSP
jgi:hypothetical protein